MLNAVPGTEQAFDKYFLLLEGLLFILHMSLSANKPPSVPLTWSSAIAGSPSAWYGVPGLSSGTEVFENTPPRFFVQPQDTAANQASREQNPKSLGTVIETVLAGDQKELFE